MAGGFGVGCYSIGEAARLTSVEPRRARYLFTGAPARGIAPVLTPTRDPVGGVLAVSFLDLIELKVAAAIREQTGCSTQRLRRRHEALRKKLRTPHPFAHSNLLTFGSALVVELPGENEAGRLTDVDTGTRLLKEVVVPFLQELEYASGVLPQRWPIAPGVMIDPRVNFGAPTLVPDGVNTRIIARTYYANGKDVAVAAWWMGVSEAGVRNAVAFERRYFGLAA